MLNKVKWEMMFRSKTQKENLMSDSRYFSTCYLRYNNVSSHALWWYKLSIICFHLSSQRFNILISGIFILLWRASKTYLYAIILSTSFVTQMKCYKIKTLQKLLESNKFYLNNCNLQICILLTMSKWQSRGEKLFCTSFDRKAEKIGKS